MLVRGHGLDTITYRQFPFTGQCFSAIDTARQPDGLIVAASRGIGIAGRDRKPDDLASAGIAYPPLPNVEVPGMADIFEDA